MDELDRLRAFRPAPEPSGVARARAAQALREARVTRRRARRPVVAIVALGATAVLATASYAIYRSVIVGSPAPADVKSIERLWSGAVKGELIPTGHARNPGIEIAKTRAAAVITTSVGPMYLWVAPDTRGDSCAYLQIVANDLPGGRPNLSGGCSAGGAGFYVGIDATRVDGRLVGILQGRIGTKGAKTVEVTFANGASRTYPVTNDYVLAETSPSDAIVLTVVRGISGHVLATRHAADALSPLQRAQQLRHRLGSIGAMRTVATLRAIGTHRLLVLKAGPGANGGACTQLTVPDVELGHGRTSGAVMTACGRPIGPTDLDIGPGQIGAAPKGLLLLHGPVGSSIRSLELRFEDGTHVTIPIHQGFILYQVSPKNYVSGHRPIELVARNAAGLIVKTRKFGFLR